MAEESTSAERTFRRNSTKLASSFSEFESVPIIIFFFRKKSSQYEDMRRSSYSRRFSKSRFVFPYRCSHWTVNIFPLYLTAILFVDEVSGPAGESSQSALGTYPGRRLDRTAFGQGDRLKTGSYLQFSQSQARPIHRGNGQGSERRASLGFGLA